MRWKSWRDWELEYEDPIPEWDLVPMWQEGDPRIPFAYYCRDPEEAWAIYMGYRGAITRRDPEAHHCNLYRHIVEGFGVVWRPGEMESCLVGHAIKWVFVVSHFCPSSMRAGVELLKAACKSSTPIIFCVPDRLAGQLVRLGFTDTTITVPQWWNGEYVIKKVIVNPITTREDLEVVWENYHSA